MRESDADEVSLATRASMDHLKPWMPWANEASTSRPAQRERCRAAEGLWETGTDYQFALRQEASGPVIGNFGLHRRVGPGAIEIGYWVHADFAGQGYGTAGARALTEASFGLDDVTRVEIHTDEANTKSAAIPRRLGYRLDRVEAHPAEAPGESGRRQVWVREQH